MKDDGRYTQQAKLQIDQDIFNINPLNIKSQCSWLNQILGDSEKNKIVGYDPKLHSIAEKLRATPDVPSFNAPCNDLETPRFQPRPLDFF